MGPLRRFARAAEFRVLLALSLGVPVYWLLR